MSGSYVLDTNVLLHLIRGNALGAKIDQAFGLRSSMHRQVVSIVTEAELWVMADRKNWGKDKRAVLQHALDNLVIIPVDGADLVQRTCASPALISRLPKVLATWERTTFG